MSRDTSYIMGCHDWIMSGRQEQFLLSNERIAGILQDQCSVDASPQFMEYLLCSIAYAAATNEGNITQFTSWFNHSDLLRSDALFETVLTHPNHRIRIGMIRLIETIGDSHLAERMLGYLTREHALDVKQAMLHCFQSLGVPLPHDVAHTLFQHDPDWVVQSYALAHLPECTSCLLIDDGTDFAAELGKIAREEGFEVVTVSTPTTFEAMTILQHLDADILNAYDVLILVRGEHYMRACGHEYYAPIRQFVNEGGHLFATSWVCWENALNDVLTDVLPFSHVHDTYHENVKITCHPTPHALAQQFFPDQITYPASYELLQGKRETVILLETDQHIPIFGFHRFGEGVCYYFNTCQHACFGHMPSPFEVNAQLSLSVQRVFHWIFDTVQHHAKANR